MKEKYSKSPDLLQAQVAAFTSERIKNEDDFRLVMKSVAAIALGDSDAETRTAGRDEVGWTADRVFTEDPDGTERTIVRSDDYVSYLRSKDGASHETISGRADILAAYENFTPIVAALKTELDESTEPAQYRSDYIGSGSRSKVFRITDGDKQYAARIPNDAGHSANLIDDHVEGAVMGKNIPHLEQIVAASYENGVTIAEILPGFAMGKLTLDEVDGISDEQLSELLDTLRIATLRGVSFDFHESNVLYDPQMGFSLLDYVSSRKPDKEYYSPTIDRIFDFMAEYVISQIGTSTTEYYHDDAIHASYITSIESLLGRFEQIDQNQNQNSVEAKV